MSEKVIYTIKGKNNVMIEMSKTFSDHEGANAFFNSIKTSSFSTPIIEISKNKKGK